MSLYPLSLHTLFNFTSLGLKIFSAVKGLTAIFSASPTYLYLLFILLFWTSQWAAHETHLLPLRAPSWLICSCGSCTERLWCGWLSELPTAPSDPHWNNNWASSWWYLRGCQKSFSKKGSLITQNRGYLLRKTTAFTGKYETAGGPLPYTCK